MLIAAFGCSWTDSYGQRPLQKNWPEYLSDLMGCNVFNGGRTQLNNQLIAQNMMIYLNQGNKPDHIVVGLTEWERITLPNRLKIDDFKFGELASGRVQEPVSESAEYRKYLRPDLSRADAVLQKKPNRYAPPYQQSGMVVASYMSVLAKYYSIPISFLNFWPTGDVPSNELITDDQFIISNHKKGGWWNHLEWNHFPHIDPNHHGNEAAEYTAERVYAFLSRGEQTAVEEQSFAEVFDRKINLFDYT